MWGFRHAFDADHLAAVTSLISKRRQHVLDAVGISGGFAFGHFLSAMIFGSVGVLLGLSSDMLAPVLLERFAGLLAGVLTILLGVWIVRGCISGACYQKRKGYRMIDWRLPQVEVPDHPLFHTAFIGSISTTIYRGIYKILYTCSICLSNWVGLLYSVAPPIPAIAAVTVVGATGNILLALSLAVAYGAGILMGMTIVGMAEGTFLEALWKRKGKAHERLMWGLGVVIVSVGIYLLLSSFVQLPALWEHGPSLSTQT